MTHPCEEIVDALRFLQGAGLTEDQLRRLHPVTGATFRGCLGYFGIHKAIRGPQALFADRLAFVAKRARAGETALDTLVDDALQRWPATAAR